MTDQEIFNALSEIESALFDMLTEGAAMDGKTASALYYMRADIQKALVTWHKITGCTN